MAAASFGSGRGRPAGSVAGHHPVRHLACRPAADRPRPDMLTPEIIANYRDPHRLFFHRASKDASRRVACRRARNRTLRSRLNMPIRSATFSLMLWTYSSP
jgi:hypothetical protein